MYYSISGGRFELSEKDNDDIEHVNLILNIYTKEEHSHLYELSVPKPIKKGKFFNSDCYCTFINEKNQVLQLGEETQFEIHMLRDGNDHERLHVKFSPADYEGKLAWVDVEGE